MVSEPEKEKNETTPEAEAAPEAEEVRTAAATAEEVRPAAASAEPERPKRRGRGGRRRVCVMCAEKMKIVDYKDVAFLRRFLSDRGRIETRRKSSCCAKHQRALSRAIKRARHLALLPYTAGHIRNAAVGPVR